MNMSVSDASATPAIPRALISVRGVLRALINKTDRYSKYRDNHATIIAKETKRARIAAELADVEWTEFLRGALSNYNERASNLDYSGMLVIARGLYAAGIPKEAIGYMMDSNKLFINLLWSTSRKAWRVRDLSYLDHSIPMDHNHVLEMDRSDAFFDYVSEGNFEIFSYIAFEVDTVAASIRTQFDAAKKSVHGAINNVGFSILFLHILYTHKTAAVHADWDELTIHADWDALNRLTNHFGGENMGALLDAYPDDLIALMALMEQSVDATLALSLA